MMRGAFLRHMLVSAAAILSGHRGCCSPSSVRAPRQKPALAPLAFFFSEPLPAPDSKIPKQGKKEKARGRGRCRLQRPPSAPVGR